MKQDSGRSENLRIFKIMPIFSHVMFIAASFTVVRWSVVMTSMAAIGQKIRCLLTGISDGNFVLKS